MTKEIWRDIPEWEGMYQVSNLGRCRSVDRQVLARNGIMQLWKGSIITPFKNRVTGRLVIPLSYQNRSRHVGLAKIVLQSFKIKGSGMAIYKDFNRDNCSLNNLKWSNK